MKEFYLQHRQFFDRMCFFVLITLIVYLFFTRLFGLLGPFFFGLLIALVLEPLVGFFMHRFIWRRWVAALVSLLVFIAAMGSLGGWLGVTLSRQVISFVESLPVHAEEFALMLDDANARIQRLSDNLPDNFYIPDIQEMVLAVVPALFGDGVRDQGVRLAVTVPNFFLNFMIALVSAYFFMADRDVIFGAVKGATPQWFRKQMRQTKAGLVRAMGGYFRAQYILMTMAGIISIIGLLILRNPYALLLGLLLAVLDFLPILGIGAVLLPWALISIIMGNVNQAIGLGVIYGIITIARQVLQPKILGDQMGAHPLASLMSIFIGFRIFGLLGLIIGPSLLMIFIAIREVDSDG